jgi:hypothetical protein
MRSLLLVGALAVSGLSIASAKSYQFTIENSEKAGTVMLKAGEYKVKVDGSNAVFTNVRTEQSFTTPVKVDNADRKHESTAIRSTVQNGTQQITAIELRGTTETLEFGD